MKLALCHAILTSFLSLNAADPHNDMGWVISNETIYMYTWFIHDPNKFKQKHQDAEIRYLFISKEPSPHAKPCTADGKQYFYQKFTVPYKKAVK